MRSSRRTALVVFLGVSSLALGCEPKVQEPSPDVRPREVATIAVATGSAKEAPKKPWGDRCVRETAATATRKAPQSPDPKCPADPEKKPALRLGKVTFIDAKDAAVTVEYAENDHDRQRGLMYRKSMPDDRGMLFWFDQVENHAFWMHNTCIPLDMLYIDADGLIVGIEENTPTMSDDTFEVGCPSKWVLEVNAGWTRAHGVRAGQRVKIESN